MILANTPVTIPKSIAPLHFEWNIIAAATANRKNPSPIPIVKSRINMKKEKKKEEAHVVLEKIGDGYEEGEYDISQHSRDNP